jgi:cation diffusion facilitator family transporter
MQQASTFQVPERSARSYIFLSIGAAVVTIVLKMGAYYLTNSVGLLSDAIESFINLLAALMALWMLTVAARPPDEEHAYGHFKAEYFSSGVESVLIILAAAGIAVAASGRLFNPQPLENVGLGLGVSLAATAINGGVALVLLRAGRRLRSISLRADADHLFTDVWTSLGVLAGVLLVQLTGWLALDPVIAFLVAANIVWTGIRLLSDTAHGLLDTALSPGDQTLIEGVLSRYRDQGIQFHALRTRVSGQHRFVSLHVLMPGDWTVQHGHNLCEQIEADIINALPRTTVFTHAEPVEDPISQEDQELERPARC